MILECSGACSAISQDDILDKATAYLQAATLLRKAGASNVILLATHGIFSDNTLQQIDKCEAVSQVVITNAYPGMEGYLSKKLLVLDVSGILAEAIRRTHNGESISYLFNNYIP